VNAPIALPPSLAASFGLTPLHFVFMAQVQNTVFGFSQESAECVLRLTPESHRSFEQIEAEIDWVRHLDQWGLPVSAPIANREGNFCQRTEIDEKPWIATAFRRAPGKIGAESAWHQGTFRTWGQITARMHIAATGYQPPHHPRRDWQSFLPSFVPETDEERVAQEKLAALVSRIEALPSFRNDFGLIHSDLHFWNFAVDGDRLTIFDFDNCEHHWFMADLGTIIFESATCIHQRLARQEFIADFMKQFLPGYLAVRDSGDLLAALPDFAKLREIQIFLTLSRRWKNREIGPFQKAFFSATREAVLTDKAFIEPATMEAILQAARP
jgi:Ser/Thr protein kinase RdoA (MazF antagonist)